MVFTLLDTLLKRPQALGCTCVGTCTALHVVHDCLHACYDCAHCGSVFWNAANFVVLRYDSPASEQSAIASGATQVASRACHAAFLAFGRTQRRCQAKFSLATAHWLGLALLLLRIQHCFDCLA